ncbi:hypothetical protein [Hirschia litorea]|uniref:Uncharacterized protein n=1 Tax=Hirschia litorea TaxID=1199156 RepID=A0ABW2INH2_9PROT
MAREIDDKKTKKALRKLRKAKARAESEDGPGLTEWEKEFFEGVEERLETFGSAFADPEKGHLDEALSARQTHIVREIDKKSRKKDGGMKRSSFKPKKQTKSKGKTNHYSPRGRDIHEDIADETPITPPIRTDKPKLKIASVKPAIELLKQQEKPALPSKPTPAKSPFRVIKGGKE